MRRFAYRCALVLLAALVALPAGLAADPEADARRGNGKGRGKGGGGKVVTRTYAGTGPIVVPAATTSFGSAPYPASATVTGLKKAKLLDVNLTLRGFGHARPDDVNILLAAPGGRAAWVVGQAGDGAAVANLTLTLDDEAAAPLPADPSPLVGGAFRPADYEVFKAGLFATAPNPGGAVALSTFDGIDPNGAWSLYVDDDLPSTDNGSIAGWEVTITAKVKNGDGKGSGNKGNGRGGGRDGGRGKRGTR